MTKILWHFVLISSNCVYLHSLLTGLLAALHLEGVEIQDSTLKHVFLKGRVRHLPPSHSPAYQDIPHLPLALV